MPEAVTTEPPEKSAKKAAKKTAVKKAAAKKPKAEKKAKPDKKKADKKEKPAKTKESQQAVFSLPDEVVPVETRGHSCGDTGADIANKARAIVAAVSGKKKNRSVVLQSAAEIRQSMLPAGHFHFQNLIGSFGIPEGKVIELIGDRGTGKTTLALSLAGLSAKSRGAYILYVGCENKNPDTKRLVRCFGPVRAEAERVAASAVVTDAFSFNQMWNTVATWVETMRGKHKAVIEDGKKAEAVSVPLRIPLVVIVDPMSKLLDPQEEAGKLDYGDNLGETKMKKHKEVGEFGSRAAAATWLHEWCRVLPFFQKEHNVTFIFTEHQNDQMVAPKGPAANLPKSWHDLHNATHRGGRATGQHASIRIIMVKNGPHKGHGKDAPPSGDKISMRTEKQSYGPPNRQIWMELRSEFTRDNKFWVEPPIHFDQAFAEHMAKGSFCGTVVEGGLYTSQRLGVYGESAEKLSSAFHADAALVKEAGQYLRLEGYVAYDTGGEGMNPPDLGTTNSEEEDDDEEGEGSDE